LFEYYYGFATNKNGRRTGCSERSFILGEGPYLWEYIPPEPICRGRSPGAGAYAAAQKFSSPVKLSAKDVKRNEEERK
jgi:hypothetical protein